MSSIRNILILAAGAAALVIPRDAAQVQSDLNTINSDTTALKNAFNSYSGGLIGAIPIMNAESTLDNDIKSATSDAQSTGPVSDSDAQSIIDYINNTLEPNIEAAIAAAEAKKSQLASAGLTSTVRSDLNTLKSDTDSLGQALVADAPADKQDAANAALAKIDSDFEGAIAAFS